jgi:hypothetical protein
MEPVYPISREQLRRYATIQAEQKKHAFILEGVNYVCNIVLKDVIPATNYTFTLNPVATTTSSEIRVSEVVDACCSKYPDVYVAVRDGPIFQLILQGVKERFPDCTFTQDPQKKYLFIDWS